MNIYTYLEYYRNLEFEELKFNDMDSLVFSLLAYIPISSALDGSSFEKLSQLLSTVSEANIHGSLGKKAKDLVELVKGSKRYQNVFLYNLKMIVDDQVQFGAITFRHSSFTYVAFEGTNASISGWIENFMLAVQYPTLTQQLAINYLQQTIKDTDKTIYVGGHSKGGNLAMTASMNVEDNIFNRIQKIYNFDGPGFREKEVNSIKFKKMNKKCLNILPVESLVGILLNNKNYQYTMSKGTGFNQHYPTNWVVFGTFFVKGNISQLSKKAQESIHQSLLQLKDSDMKKMLNQIRLFFKENSIVYAKDITDLKFMDLKKMLNDYKEIDPESKKAFLQILKLLVNPKK